MDNTPAPSPGYWAVIPALIRYDDQICANAKLLYAEISSLINDAGFCWADNGYFARLYRVSERSIRTWLEQLEGAGYIRTQEKRGQRNAVQWRRIYAAVNPLTGVKNPDFSLEENFQTGSRSGFSLEDNFQTDGKTESSLEENFRSLEENFQTYNNITNSITRESPRSTPRSSPRITPECLPERFEAFWKFYRSIPGEGGQPRNEKRAEAVRAWDKLRPDDKLVDRIGRALQRQLRTADWRKGVGIPMAATYLNQRRWEDAEELPEADELLSPADGPNAPIPTGKDVVWV